MLEVRGLSANYGGIQALRGVDIDVSAGEVVALLGSNGAGKSTLLGCLTSSADCHSTGSIMLEGRELHRRPTDAIIRAGMVMVPEGRQVFGDLTVRENLMMGAYLQTDAARQQDDMRMVLELFPALGERSRQLAKTLSGGEQQMVAIGRALMARPKLLLLDEPSLGLAPKLVHEIFSLIARINARGVSILLIEQNAKQALRISNRAYVLEKGVVTIASDATSLANDPHVVAVYLGGT